VAQGGSARELEARIREEAAERLPGGHVSGHGYTPSGTDYEVTIDDSDGGRRTYRFTDCHEVTCRTKVHDIACDELFSGYESWVAAGCPEGTAPGPGDGMLPMLAYVRDSGLARHWSHVLDRDMHELEVETGPHVIRLVCRDLVVKSVPSAHIEPARGV
jgi:hypothetical protein